MEKKSYLFWCLLSIVETSGRFIQSKAIFELLQKFWMEM